MSISLKFRSWIAPERYDIVGKRKKLNQMDIQKKSQSGSLKLLLEKYLDH